MRIPAWCIWPLVALLAAAAFLHLGADFPNGSRWMDDAAKYTDEGWYASGALNHALTGHWLRPGDFNPMVTIPVWSALLGLLFHFTGISIVLARAVAVLFTLGSVLAGGAMVARDHRRVAPLFMLLLLASPLLFFFSRMAILEPALIFFLLISALAAYGTPVSLPRLIVSGTLFAVALLTKSSAVFAAPALLYLIWFPLRNDRRRAIRSVLIAAGTALLLYGIYWLLLVHTHPGDARVLLHENRPYLGARSFAKAVRILYRSVTWIDPILFPAAVAAVIASFTRLRRMWLDPLFGFAVFFYLGYSVFLLLHFDAEPHYFVVLLIPTLLLVTLLLDALRGSHPRLAGALTGLVAAAVLCNVGYIAMLLSQPTYTLRDAARQMASQIVDRERSGATPLIIGHGAIQTTFFHGIPALDDLGIEPVAEKLSTEHPGWLITLDPHDPIETRPGVAGNYTFMPAGKYRLFDNSGRQYLFLFLIDKKTAALKSSN